MSLKSHSPATPIDDIILTGYRMNQAPKIRFLELPNNGDARGFSFTAPAEALEYVGPVVDLRLASNGPGAMRGNHYHVKGRMALLVLPGPKWSFHWDDGEGSEPQHRVFDGKAAVVVLIPTGASHAVRNEAEGESQLWMTTISSDKYDATDRRTRKVL